MHITLNKHDLTTALDTIEKAVSKSNTLPILQGVLICAGDTVELSATNTQVYAKSTIDCRVDDVGSVIVDGKLFSQAVKKLGDVITLETKGDKLNIQSGRSRFSLGIINEDFPAMTTDAELIHMVEAEDLQRVIKQTTFATIDNPAKPYTGGVMFGEYAVSTDANRLAIAPLGMSGDYILPASSLAILNKLSSQVTIHKASNELIFCDERNRIAIRLIDSKFPDWKSLVPLNAPISLVVERKDFLGVIGRASLVSGDYNAVKLSVDEGLVTASIQGEINEFEESIEVEHEGSGELHLSAKYLADYLKVAEGDQVTLGLNDNLRPCLLTSGDYRYILMPVRRG